MAIFAAVAHVGEHVAKRRGVARHFQTNVEAFLHAELFLHLRSEVISADSPPGSTPILRRVPADMDSDR